MNQPLNGTPYDYSGAEKEAIPPNPVLSLEASRTEDTIEEEGGNEEARLVVFSAGKPRNDWQIFTSHGLVLISVLNNPGRTVREIGLELNLTDRAVAIALADLVAEGYMARERVGRRTFYHVNEEHALRYPVSPYGTKDIPFLTVKALRAENLATHAPTSAL